MLARFERITDTMSLRHREDALFADWLRVRDDFVPDGVIDEVEYLQSRVRVLMVLKENNGFYGGDIRSLLRDGERTPTWLNVTRWLKGIGALPAEVPWTELESIDLTERQRLLRSISVMNLKKSPGGHTAESRNVWRVAREDRMFLKRQFDLYDPHLIICCGSTTSACFHEVVLDGVAFDFCRTRRGVPYYARSTGRFVVEYPHPEARVQDNLLCYGLIDAVREVIGPRETG